MDNIVRFGISMDAKLLAQFDHRIARKGYDNRSEAIRDLVRADLVTKEWEHTTGEVVGTISLVYDHHLRQLPKRLTSFQHGHYQTILSSLHVHLDETIVWKFWLSKKRNRRFMLLPNALLQRKASSMDASLLRPLVSD
jgi:CopG family transcriptional regulator, nickel-responsive regulator